jgi:DNA-binding beta-propeller fold protein YncE
MAREAQHRAEALDRYWDAVVSGEPVDEAIDVGEIPIQLIHRLQFLADTPGREAAQQRIWSHLTERARREREETLMRTLRADATWPSAGLTMGRNGHRDAGLPGPNLRHSPWRFPPPVARFAAVILIVVLLVGSAVAALYPLRLRNGDGLSLVAPSDSAAVDPAAPIGLDLLWKSTGGPEPLSQPYGLGVAPDGNVWVADGANDRFQILASDGTFLETWGTSGSGEGQLDLLAKRSPRPGGYGDVAFDEMGNIYVIDVGNFRIQKFAPDRSFLLAWGSEGTGTGQFVIPGGISVGADGAVYVSDEGRSDVQKFDSDGHWLATIGERGAEEGQFLEPAGLAVDAAGDVWVADFSNNRIQHLDADGNVVDAWGEYGRGDGQLSYPADVAVDALGRVFVPDMENSRLQVFTGDGRFLAAIGDVVGPVQLWSPISVAVNDEGMVFVADDTGVQAFRVVPSP